MTYTRIVSGDVDPEVKYWESAVACFMLGASPPLLVLTSFIKRIWHDFLIDRIIIMFKNGVLLVRFDYVETRDKVLLQGCYHFDKKPFIVKPRHKDNQKDKIE